MRRIWGLALCVCLVGAMASATWADGAYAFIFTSDPQYRDCGGTHYELNMGAQTMPCRTLGNRGTVAEIRRLIARSEMAPDDALFALPGGARVRALAVKGTLVAGDLTDAGESRADGDRDQFEHWQSHWLARLPQIYEGYGNHDLRPMRTEDGNRRFRDLPVVKSILARNPTRVGLVDHDARNGHYSWRWGEVLYINLNAHPGGTDPANGLPLAGPRPALARDSLVFLKAQLDATPKRQAVVLMMHIGFNAYSISTHYVDLRACDESNPNQGWGWDAGAGLIRHPYHREGDAGPHCLELLTRAGALKPGVRLHTNLCREARASRQRWRFDPARPGSIASASDPTLCLGSEKARRGGEVAVLRRCDDAALIDWSLDHSRGVIRASGRDGRPLCLASRSWWWSPAERAAFFRVIAGRNVKAVLSGHWHRYLPQGRYWSGDLFSQNSGAAFKRNFLYVAVDGEALTFYRRCFADIAEADGSKRSAWVWGDLTSAACTPCSGEAGQCSLDVDEKQSSSTNG